MAKRRVGIMLDLTWQYRRHVDVFAGTQKFSEERGYWRCEIDEFIDVGLQARKGPTKLHGIIARATPELARRARLARVPLVNVWYASEVRDKLPGVFPDYAEIGRLAGVHLAERGFRTFACLSSSRETADGIMTDAFHRVIEEHGCECHCAKVSRLYYRSRDSWKRFQRGLDQWIKTWTPPIAVFVSLSDVTARYVVHACRRHGLKVPEDVALITATDEMSVTLVPPPALTSIEIDYKLIGYKAAQLLDGLMRGRKAPAEPMIVQPTGIIARNSTEFFAVDDTLIASAMRFIEKNATDRIGVDAVANALGVSRRTLERRFTENVGRHVSTEIRRLRLTRAKRLLAESDLLIKQIASQTGFGSAIRLSEVFVRELGMTPTEYRESMA